MLLSSLALTIHFRHAGLDPAIHVFLAEPLLAVDARVI
jgi:hypothetical protein